MDENAGIVHAKIMREVLVNRIKAHEKHGEKSIEAISISFDRLNTILVEEVGEVSKALNDEIVENWSENRLLAEVRKELIDVMTVASAWVARIDRISK